MKPESKVPTPGGEYTEVLPLRDGKLNGGQRIMFDAYRCMNGGAPPTTAFTTTCDNAYPSSALMIHGYQASINVKFYDNPVAGVHKEIDRVMPMVGLRYEADMVIGWVDLYTDTGQISKNWVEDHVPTLISNVKVASEKSMANIAKNYLSQGKIIMADFEYHLEIASSNDRTEIWRYYFTVIDVFAAVGGL